MKYTVIDEHRGDFPVKTLCRVLDISRSLYYAFKKARPSLRSQEDLALRAAITRINAAHRWAPGAVKMWHLLKAEGIMYRTMSKEQYTQFMESGNLPGTTEKSISPSLAYSSKYDGVTVKITTAAGTSAQLQEIGIAANTPAAAQFRGM